MTKTAYFKHVLTGKVDKYPEGFGDLFPEHLERVTAKDYNCVDCGPKAEPDFASEFGVGEAQDDFDAPDTDDDEIEVK